ncbi:hypothetical protein P152DRAFT_81936 [Eremomyces bilateralis CBS 781.70]|uniref:Uncharacterized protein n=1 Tax=Eremomyces bilateralis CBS 781.70 TaxID=1392243 RepID=A0A6G1FYE8_9PEZI|nr:uncharacterized protein P152DRAFT_81936 [Eremomyces bilateralis CBS 781.70]KAF1810742.1 hypothetical protein P152DRAFT_81936 [Eremomyces bilateralis CBS 781.70]
MVKRRVRVTLGACSTFTPSTRRLAVDDQISRMAFKMIPSPYFLFNTWLGRIVYLVLWYPMRQLHPRSPRIDGCELEARHPFDHSSVQGRFPALTESLGCLPSRLISVMTNSLPRTPYAMKSV